MLDSFCSFQKQSGFARNCQTKREKEFETCRLVLSKFYKFSKKNAGDEYVNMCVGDFKKVI